MRYRAELLSFLRKGDQNGMPHLKLVTEPMDANWENDKQRLTDLADQVPDFSNPKFSMSRTRFSDVYGDFLNNLNIPSYKDDPVVTKKLRDLEKKLQDIEDQEFDAYDACEQRYNKRYVERKVSESQFVSLDYYVRYRCTEVQRYKDLYTQVFAEKITSERDLQGEWFFANEAKKKYYMTKEKYFEEMGSLKEWLVNVREGKTNYYKITIEETSQKETKDGKNWGFGVGLDAMIKGVTIGVNVGVESTKLKISSSLKEFKMHFGAKGLKAIPVYPKRDWFTPGVLQKYRNGPFRKNERYFGKGGRMGLVPKTFFLVTEPFVTMWVNKQDHDELHKTFKVTADASIGFMQVANLKFNFNYGSEHHSVQDDKNLYKIELVSKDPTPQLLAVDYEEN
jgi:hypothetical protein